MSCLAPISIPDKALSRYGVKMASILVPCGHCAECARRKRNDWFVRIWSTYQRCHALGIPVWFVTITIDPHLWPNMTLDSDGIGDRITPFVRSWNERFRYLNGGKMPLRFLCSEFGSKGREYVDFNGVCRVTTGALHFHGLLFGWLDVHKLQYGLSQTHGHVDFDLIRGPEAIRYTVKYATKDYSIEDPKLRARVFCSPGIGDSTYYFGDGPATQMVLINGFHYATPRYFIDKQWQHVYGKENFFDVFGRSAVVRLNTFKRYKFYRASVLSAEQEAEFEPRLRSYVRWKRLINASRPASLERVLQMYDFKATGASHPLLRFYLRRLSFHDYTRAIESDRSFNIDGMSIEDFLTDQSFVYERHQTFFPLSLDFET